MTESFFPGPQSIAACDSEAREELFELFPELKEKDYHLFGNIAAYGLKSYEAELLLMQ